MSITEELVLLIEAQALQHGFQRAARVHVKLGALGHVAPEALRFCFDAAARGTPAEGACLDIHVVPGVGWCPNCQCGVALNERHAPCPRCGSGPLRLEAGDELQLTELEVE
ncbi:hydrogenase maturation nickel metallochaperone HypA [Aquabacterium sp. A7-Y]|uniref:hydrogenase maturation nickel metallochaperone HypA/HybF n=1 Tax=Aquabacterium sp. A7-Y TaxID=1349605 RepID=UPI00223CF3B0|nr:hydrogenase maturation nickel metallochaperone HypA [Aquabacterium sp. A7-Y]MCW7541119.1 hydrogenase maturation nickel metallochaperone HypA [Aquabacterium sp. A7-Y]